MLPISLAPAEEENLPGSSDEDESETEEEGVRSRGENRPRQEVDGLATLDIDDDVTDDKALLPFEVPAHYSLVSSAPAALELRHALTKRLCFGWVWAGSGGSSHERLMHARTTATTLECFSRPTAARAV